MKKNVPNFLTSLNLIAGCIAAIMAFEANYFMVVIWLIIAAIFDFADGLFARLLKAYSPIGKELDSLADMISFGIVPGITIYTYLSKEMFANADFRIFEFVPFVGFMITAFSALRLAKFNNDIRQTSSFIGLPTPACALFWTSLIYALNQVKAISFVGNNLILYGIIILIFCFSFLLVSEIRMFSMKLKNLNIKENWHVFLFLIITAICMITFDIFGIFIGILFYIMISLFRFLTYKIL